MATYGPYAETTPNGQTGWINETSRPVHEHFLSILNKLDGVEKYTYSIWRGTNIENIVVTRSDIGETFIQAAGSADAMTVEARLVADDGKAHLYTLGKQPEEQATVLIPISSERSVQVFANEVFTASEAADIFNHYYLSDSVENRYLLRELDLSIKQSEETA